MVDYYEIDRDHPRPDLIHRAARALREGKLVACPTDTTYAIFAAYDQREAVARLTQLRMDMKGDPEAAEAEQQKTLSMIFSDFDMLSAYVVMSGLAYQIVKRLLPGPYTIILPAARSVPKQLQNRRRELGARIPDHDVACALVKALGTPVLSTTAKNRQGELAGDATEVAENWPHHIDLVLDAGPFVPEPSTVLAIESDHVSVIREGKGSVDSI
jgi:tRNA threonylcarbamoyl adenosine modification protein (Sua5/YciO/YrdC/YwlC family)